jgi:hypothetical protein
MRRHYHRRRLRPQKLKIYHFFVPLVPDPTDYPDHAERYDPHACMVHESIRASYCTWMHEVILQVRPTISRMAGLLHQRGSRRKKGALALRYISMGMHARARACARTTAYMHTVTCTPSHLQRTLSTHAKKIKHSKHTHPMHTSTHRCACTQVHFHGDARTRMRTRSARTTAYMHTVTCTPSHLQRTLSTHTKKIKHSKHTHPMHTSRFLDHVASTVAIL